MRNLDPRLLGLAWVGFAAFFALLNYLLDGVVSGFSLAMSAIGAIPVALIIAVRARRKRDS